MSKGFKKILAIGVAIAIPFAAPAIVGAVAGSAAVSGIAGGAVSSFLGTAAGKVAGSAIIGGLASKATGGSFVQGAISGGVGGLMAGPTSAAGSASTAGGAAKGVASAGSNAARSVGTAAGGVAKGVAHSAVSNVASGVASTAPATLGSKIMGAISSVGGKISQGLTDPDMWGRAAQYLGAAALGKATAKPDPALQAYIKELDRVSKDNRTIQQAAFGVGNELVSEARGINPIAEGQIEANEAQLRVLGAGQQAVRNMPASKEAMRAVGTQQYYTDAARAGASAFNIGFRGGRADKRAGLQGAYSGVPLLQAQGGTAAQLSMQQAQNEGSRQAGLLESLKYITTGQQPAGQQTQGQEPAGGVNTSSFTPPGSVTGRPVLPDPNNPVYGTVGI